MLSKIVFIIAVLSCASCISFRDSPFSPVHGPFVGLAQVKRYEEERVLRDELRSELGEPEAIDHQGKVERWTYISIWRRTGLERRGLARKATCQYVRYIHVFSIENSRVSSVATDSRTWSTSDKDDPECGA